MSDRKQVQQVAGSEPRVTSRPFGVVFLLLLALGLSGCAQQPNPNDPAAQTVLRFFELLADGNAADVSDLLAPDAPVLSGDESLLSDELYGATVARPRNAVVERIDVRRDQTLVQAEYELEGSSEKRSLGVILVEVNEQLRIRGWTHQRVAIATDFPGTISLNGIEQADPNGRIFEIVALPGVYEVKYVDTEKLGTTDVAGGKSEAFTVEFPVRDLLEVTTNSSLVETDGGVMRFLPRLTDVASESLLDELRASAERCTTELLVGSSCPPELVSFVEAQSGQVDPSSVSWQTTAPGELVPGDAWKFTVGLNPSWQQGDQMRELSSTFNGKIVGDGSGRITQLGWITE